MKFKVGDRVTRHLYMDDGTWMQRGDSCLPGPMRHGTITRAYSMGITKYGEDVVLGPYPELYGVMWDDGKYTEGYLPHGLELETVGVEG